jgi:GTP-binding protein
MKPADAFIDDVTITVAAGRGGNGLVSMRREKFVEFGGPNGGDGGRGGDVVLVADRNLGTLLDHRMRREYHAEDGQPGGNSNKKGRAGETIEIRVPIGTVVTDTASPDEPLLDLTEDGQRAVVARGGSGGRGNTRFKTSTRQTPDFAEPGRPGGLRKLRLALKLLADVGLVGFPNAGKSTLLGRVSAARPRVASYPFTTLIPSLGVAELEDRRFVVADIPGLIEGASRGAGLGDRFLRHIERTRVLVHLLDCGAALVEDRDLISDYEKIRAELGAYEPALLEREEIVALNKVDVAGDTKWLPVLEKELARRGCQTLRISGVTGEGIPELLARCVAALAAADASEEADAAEQEE